MEFLYRLKRFLPHLVIAMLLALAVITILHGFNPAMGFLTSKVSKLYIYAVCVFGIILGIVSAVDNGD